MAQVKDFLSDNLCAVIRFRYFCSMRPDIYFFNPTCELAVANGSANFMAPAKLRQFERELSTLPWLLAKPKDIILVDQVPPQQFNDQLENAGFNLPEFSESENCLSNPAFLTQQFGFLFPWGWSPAAHHFLSPLKSGCCPEYLNAPVSDWRQVHRELYSRKSALKILHNIVINSNSDDLPSLKELPEICTTHEDILRLQQKWPIVVVKAPWSSSGRGLQILRKNEYNQTNRQVISGVLKQQQYVVAGPWHQKIMDLSFQFFSLGNGKIEYRGLSSFSTDTAGRYKGNFIQELPPDLPDEVNLFIQRNLEKIRIAITDNLIASEYSTGYYGWIGVDALIYQSADGKLKFHPCIEINCRYTMGAIAIALRSHLAAQSTGEFRIIHGNQGHFAKLCEEMRYKEPLIVESGKIIRGFLPVTPPFSENSFGAYISVKEANNLTIRQFDNSTIQQLDNL